MEKDNSKTNSSVVNLEIFDLQENHLVELPTVFSVTKLPVTKEDIPRQSDVNRWRHLEGVSLPEIDVEVELLIGNDVPEALQPFQILGTS